MERLTYNFSNIITGLGGTSRFFSKLSRGKLDAAISKLRDYEDAEEQGLLVRLPCKVGTPVFIIEKYADGSHIVPDMFDYYDLSAFGKTVFLTREEAEEAEAALKGEGEDV